ncbi:MAG TPA: galactose-1-phosphate uridylyltransferase [Burkholderiaceae bacterium]|nr:galactose-1-phosphate uridylyltransferase [Burkholderiaceae bacterium]
MHVVELTKIDGRSLTLYARAPFEAPAGPAPSPFAEPLTAHPHLRWHPVRGEWVTYAAHRQGRTFLPPAEYDPLAPTRDPAHPTELPDCGWEVAVFDNRFPSLSPGASEAPVSIVPTAPGLGRCEVVVFGPDPVTPFGSQPLERIELVLGVWADRCRRLATQPGLAFALPFENRGVEMGVTLHHPHGQIYAYPSVPPVPARMAAVAREHVARHGRGPLTEMIERELADGARIVYRGSEAVAFVPACARYPYETWVAPIAPVASFEDLSRAQLADLARATKTVLRKYERLWDRPFPYLMAWYPAPFGGAPGWHLHAQLWPPYRTRDRLKYLAGTELAAGFFAMDALPEEKAAELQRVDVSADIT